MILCLQPPHPCASLLLPSRSPGSNLARLELDFPEDRHDLRDHPNLARFEPGERACLLLPSRSPGSNLARLELDFPEDSNLGNEPAPPLLPNSQTHSPHTSHSPPKSHATRTSGRRRQRRPRLPSACGQESALPSRPLCAGWSISLPSPSPASPVKRRALQDTTSLASTALS